MSSNDQLEDNEEHGPGNGDRRTWHLDKSIPLAFIVSLIVGVYAFSNDQSRQDERISLTESAVQSIQRSQSYDRRRTEKQFDNLKSNLRSIDSKLDRIIEDK